MSHFSEVKTNLKNKEIIKKSLKKLGYSIEEAKEGVEVRGFFGDAVSADFKILTDTHYDIGFKEHANGNFEIIGDWELLPKVSGIDQTEFTNTLKRQYAVEAITEVAQSKGYDLSFTQSENEELEMVVTQW